MNQKQRVLFLCLSLATISFNAASYELGCRNPKGQLVSWWVLLKTPNTLNDYVYRDSGSSNCHDSDSCWGTLHHDLSDPEDGPLSQTLQQLYKTKKEQDVPGFLMYNDDTSFVHASSTHSSYAHAKGVLSTTANGGFWLVHSVPRFPRQQVGSEAYTGITDNGRVHGQSFLCISLELEQVKVALSQLVLAHPYIYQSGGFDNELKSELGEDLKSLLGDKEIANKEQQARTSPLVATDGTVFTSVIKSRYWGKELYADLVSQVLNSDLLVETWNKGQGTLPSSCRTDHSVANVTKVQISSLVQWDNHKDHSKWAVTTEESGSHSVCIGDINRQNGQKVRGGGTVCVNDENLWRAFHGMVKGAESCGLD